MIVFPCHLEASKTPKSGLGLLNVNKWSVVLFGVVGNKIVVRWAPAGVDPGENRLREKNTS